MDKDAKRSGDAGDGAGCNAGSGESCPIDSAFSKLFGLFRRR